MDMVKVFEEQIIRTTEKKLNTALNKLKEYEFLQQNFRELADISHQLKKVTYIVNELTSEDKERKEWKMKQENLGWIRDKLFSTIGQEGFEHGWISTIVDSEIEQLKVALKNAREMASKKYLNNEKIKDVDVLDERLDLVGEEIEKARTLYIQGKTVERTQ